MKKIYLDHAAATPLDKNVARVMDKFWAEKFYNPSAGYLAAKEVRDEIEAARGKVARILGTKPAEVIFTAGGSESNNLAIRGIMDNFRSEHVAISAIEHESVLRTASQYNLSIFPVKKDGLIDINQLAKIIKDETVLVSIMYANNEIGTVQPLAQVGQLISQIREDRQKNGNNLPLYFHTDASQAANYQDLHVDRLKVDLMTLSGSKIYGPKQSSCLYVRGGIELLPIVFGGGQESGLRSGTENVPAIIGFSKALEIAQEIRKQESYRLSSLKNKFIEEIKQSNPDVIINGNQKHCLPNVVSLTFPDVDGESLMMLLDQMGVMISTGSACSASDDSPSHVLKSIGLSEQESNSTIRVSMGRLNSEQDINAAIDAFKKALSGLQFTGN
ncbi:cysteine desulfurase [Candidatus Saccharibacteria bacterium CPR2]|nr:cysteine desulfurase [Candidatus Saccharibacteria bacterium CPR2]